MKKIINKSIDLGQAIEAHNLRKLKIKHIKPHTNFAEEIYQQEKTDKFFNRILIPLYIICTICAILLVIVNIK